MQLRARRLDQDLSTEAMLVDPRVCDCCPTASAATPEGSIVVYRDRSDEEIRDIYASRFDATEGTWSTPVPVARDNWRISGCPVNGPAVGTRGSRVAVAWFTGHPTPRVRVALSTDGGVSFAPAVTLTEQGVGEVTGRVDLAWHADELLVTAVVDAKLWLYRLTPERTKPGLRLLQEPRALVELDPSRATGMPSILRVDDVLHVAWTDAGGAQLRQFRLADQ